MTKLERDVLKLFVDYADRELCADDVRMAMAERGRVCKGNRRYAKTMVALHEAGRLFRNRDGHKVWYCVAREMR